MTKIKGINIEGNQIAIIQINNDDYISLTDMAKSQHQEVVIFKWMSSKSTIENLGEWELLYNPNSNYTEFGIISLCKKTTNTALFSFLKQSFTKSKLLDFRNFESLVFDAFLSKTEKGIVFLLTLIRSK